MYVAEFIQILHRYISLGTNQPAFSEELICHASLSYKTERYDKDDRYSESRFKDFCRGDVQGNEIVGDLIGYFACKYLRDINEASLDSYLANQILKASEDSRLRTVFQAEFAKLPPDASDDSKDVIMDDNGNSIAEETVQLAKQIRRLFVHVINECIREYNRNKNKGKASTLSTAVIPRSDLDRIKEIVMGLCIKIESLKDLGAVYNSKEFLKELSDESVSNSRKQKYLSEYDQFSSLDQALYYYCTKHPIEPLKKVKQFTKSCNIDSFVMRFKMRMIKCETGTDPSLNNECDQKTVCVEYGPNVDLYYDALIELSRELDNL